MTAQFLEQYTNDGIVFPIPLLSPDEVVLYRNALESIAERSCEVSQKRFANLHRFFPWAYRLATNETLLNIVEKILGPDILLDGTLVFYIVTSSTTNRDRLMMRARGNGDCRHLRMSEPPIDENLENAIAVWRSNASQ